MTDISQLTSLQKDGLREIGNIGTGKAASYLSERLDREVMIDVPHVDITSLPDSVQDVPDLLEEQNDTKHIGALCPTDTVNGGFLLSFPREDHVRFLHLLEDADITGGASDRENFLTISQQIADYYLDAVDQLLSVDVHCGPPRLMYLPQRTMLIQTAVSIYNEMAQQELPDVLVIKTGFTVTDQVQGSMLLLVQVSDTGELLSALEQVVK